jgi:hypothetical protein
MSGIVDSRQMADEPQVLVDLAREPVMKLLSPWASFTAQLGGLARANMHDLLKNIVFDGLYYLLVPCIVEPTSMIFIYRY